MLFRESGWSNFSEFPEESAETREKSQSGGPREEARLWLKIFGQKGRARARTTYAGVEAERLRQHPPFPASAARAAGAKPFEPKHILHYLHTADNI